LRGALAGAAPGRRGPEPYPDVLLEDVPDSAPGPEARYERKEAVELAFIAALQHLPPRQRTTLVLRDVLGFRAAEVGAILHLSDMAVASALKRARTALDDRLSALPRDRMPLPDSAAERDLVGRLARAFEAGDIDAVVALITDDAWFAMPPEPVVEHGRDAIGAFLGARFAQRGDRRYRLIPTRANTQPAYGFYVGIGDSPLWRAHGLMVVALHGDRVTSMVRFCDNSVLARFGLPRSLRASAVPRERPGAGAADPRPPLPPSELAARGVVSASMVRTVNWLGPRQPAVSR
jgi:RNA polymerase sigma-70 factor (TIGR02960 family)